jgi:exocyst complex protein 7
MTHSTSPELQSALNGPISTLRGLAVRSFPELLVDIRTAQGSGQTSVTSDTTYSTLTYLETLPAYEKTVEGLLGRSQSERSWLMGAKETPSLVRSAGEEGGVVNLFVGTWTPLSPDGSR